MAGKISGWFNNRPLRFKLTSLFLLVLIIMQIASGVIITNVVEKKLRDDLLLSNQIALKQMAANIDEMLMNIVEDLYPVITKAQSTQVHNTSVQSRENEAEFAPDGDYAAKEEAANNFEYITNNIEYQQLFNQLISSRNNYRFIHSMLILGEDESAYTYFTNAVYGLAHESLFEKLKKDYSQTGKQYIWTDVLDGAYFFPKYEEPVVSLIVPVWLYKKVRNFVVLNISVSRLQAYISTISSENNSVILQTLQGGFITNQNSENFSILSQLSILSPDYADKKDILRDGEYVLLTTRLTVNGWSMSMLYSDAATDGVLFLLRAILPLLIGIGLIMMASSGFIVSKVTRPLWRLTEIIRTNTTDHKRELRFHAKHLDEVGILGDAYNRMMDEVENEQLQSRLAYMKMLQMQIKPHFLYNSMESTRFLVEMGDSRAVDMIRAIVTYYKLSLSGTDELVAIEKEMEHLGCYLQILQIRYASRYDYEINIDADMLNDEIEKFTLQPLVENAIYHGIKMKRGKGSVSITGYKENGNNIIEVLDNGIGIAQPKLHELQASLRESKGIAQTDHIGVLNVHQRLRMRYGADYGLQLESVEGEYTRVRVVIPAICLYGSKEAADA